jgi:AcrR family transcriptional regulator
LAIVLSSDCINVARIVQIVTNVRWVACPSASDSEGFAPDDGMALGFLLSFGQRGRGAPDADGTARLTLIGIIDRRRAEGRHGTAPRHAGRPTRNAAAALPARILDAAQELFLSQGFEATSLNQIAAGAAATKRTLYVKIGDKAELFAHVVRRLLDQRRQKLNDTAATGSSAERLIRFGENLLDVALDPDVLRLYRVMVAEAPRFPALASLMEEQITHGAHANLTELLRTETGKDRITPDDPETAAELLLTMIISSPQRAALFGLEPWDKARRSHWVRAAVGLFLQGRQPEPGA